MSTSRKRSNETSKANNTGTTTPKKSHTKHKNGSLDKSVLSDKLISNDFKNEHEVCDCANVTIKDLNKAVDEIFSKNTIESALERNANLFAESILDLQERVIVVEAKIESLEDRMEEVEQLAHIRHQRHIERVVRKIMKEFPECPKQMTELGVTDHTKDLNSKRQFDEGDNKASEQKTIDVRQAKKNVCQFPVVTKDDRFCKLESRKVCACTPNYKNEGTNEKKLSRSKTTMIPQRKNS
ncbi:uncharacterized protein Dwil_GK26992 [Drosophila willistoni]|uniref:Uncharacterized protein n=1 Tax=Drosophila willistoni TaxID=7260 RepID=A0A0Q9WT81_DROWI|nr:uncharacterized protein LOC6646914 isoform X1 [Drosophila willistoni]KRF99454.1 uncharacterized protein Dwil_GK26992 [Drosophila willistoni]